MPILSLNYPPGRTPVLSLVERYEETAEGPITGVATVGDATLYEFDLDGIPSADYAVTSDDPEGSFVLRINGEQAQAADDYDDLTIPQPGIPEPGNPIGPGEDFDEESEFTLADITCDELDKSREQSDSQNQSREIRYYGLTCPDALIGYEYLEGIYRSKLSNTVPAEVDGRVIRAIDLRQLGAGRVEAMVEYGLADATQEFEFDTTGGTARIRQSFATRKYGTGPSFGGLINCHDGKVDGVDIPVPSMSYSESRSFINVSYAYRNALRDLVGFTNKFAWKGFAPFEVLYLGTQGRKVGRELWRLRFFFSTGKNVTNLLMGSGITVTRKDAWEYLWTYHEPEIDSGENVLVPRPKAHFVETVHRSIDFAVFGIGT